MNNRKTNSLPECSSGEGSSLHRLLIIILMPVPVILGAAALLWYSLTPTLSFVERPIPVDRFPDAGPEVAELAKLAERCETISISVWDFELTHANVRVSGADRAIAVIKAIRENGRLVRYNNNESYLTSDLIWAVLFDSDKQELLTIKVYSGDAVHVLVNGNEYVGEKGDDTVANLLLSYVGAEPYPLSVPGCL